jgi:hypothetical protein
VFSVLPTCTSLGYGYAIGKMRQESLSARMADISIVMFVPVPIRLSLPSLQARIDLLEIVCQHGAKKANNCACLQLVQIDHSGASSRPLVVSAQSAHWNPIMLCVRFDSAFQQRIFAQLAGGASKDSRPKARRQS